MAQHARDAETYGPRLAGKAPDVGDVPPEAPIVDVSRTHWEEQDTGRGERSLERYPTEEVYCLVQEKGKWTFPSTAVGAHEGLDEAVRRGLLGKEGTLGGEAMDSWIVTRKPVALSKSASGRVSLSLRNGNILLSLDILPEIAYPRWGAAAVEWSWMEQACVAECARGRGSSADAGRRSDLGGGQGGVWSSLLC